MLPYQLYLYFWLSWLVPVSLYLQLPLGIKFSSCDIKTLIGISSQKSMARPLPNKQTSGVWEFKADKHTGHSHPWVWHLHSPERFESQAADMIPGTKTWKTQMHGDTGLQVTLRPKQSWSSLHALPLSPYEPLTPLQLAQTFTIPKQGQFCLSTFTAQAPHYLFCY